MKSYVRQERVSEMMIKLNDMTPGEWFKRDQDMDDITVCMKVQPFTGLDGKHYVAINNYGELLASTDVTEDEQMLPVAVFFDAGYLLEQFMKMQAYKYEIFPNNDQKDLFDRTFAACRFVSRGAG